MTKIVIDRGYVLEARVQRLFMCQGAFAERGLLVRAAKRSSKLVTDIDIVAHDYNINFSHTRFYAECKTGKNVSTLDRIVWVKGMMNLVGANIGYFVTDRCDSDSVAFASSQGVNVLQEDGLQTLEQALHISDTFWPGRSNIREYNAYENLITKELKTRSDAAFHGWLFDASITWRESPALIFSYAKLNSLIGILEYVPRLHDSIKISGDMEKILHYSVAALLVRFSQFVLFAAKDTLGMTKTEREKYLALKLTIGDSDADNARNLLNGALNLAKAKLDEQGAKIPSHWTADHLLKPPSYAKAFAELVERIIADGTRSRLLPLAMEILLFGFGGNERGSSNLIRRVEYSLQTTAVVKAFMVQSLKLSDQLLNGPDVKGIKKPSLSAEKKKEDQEEFPNLL